MRAEPPWPRPTDPATEPEPGAPARFPWAAVQIVSALVLVHLGLVLWAGGPVPPGRRLLLQGGLLRGATLDEPWRLLTSLFLHSDPAHALWNGVSMLVFAVPLLSGTGFARTALIYLASGLGGGLAALYFAAPGTLIVGSSGAVAGLFGAWAVLRLRRARSAPLGRRERIRALGIAMLVLPALLRPATPAGEPISVSSHLGGLLTGMLIGAVLSAGLAPGDDGLDADEGLDDEPATGPTRG